MAGVDSTSGTGTHKTGQAFLRPILHVAGAFALLCLVGLTAGTGPSSAGPTPSGYEITVNSIAVKAVADDEEERPVIEIATAEPNSPEAAFRSTSFDTAWVLLGLAIGVLAVFNLALYRHMRLAYSRQRLRARRGR